jgi:hypothetical protein
MSSLGIVFVENLFFQSENEFEDIEMNIWENVFAKLIKNNHLAYTTFSYQARLQCPI